MLLTDKYYATATTTMMETINESVTWLASNMSDEGAVEGSEGSGSSVSREVVLVRLAALPVIIALGTVGNGLSLLVLSRRHMRTTSVYHYLLLLACSDTVVLWLSAFKTWVRELSHWELLHVSDLVCKLVIFVLLVAQYTSSWLLVLITVDRFIVVCFPFEAHRLCSVLRVRLTSSLLVVVVILVNVHVFWTYKLLHFSGRLYCVGDQQLTFMRRGHFEVVKLVSYCFVPFIVVLAMNVAIIHKLRLGGRRDVVSAHAQHRGGGAAVRSGHVRITYMLLTVTFCWIAMTAPYALQIFMGDLYLDPLYKTCIFLLMYTNHSVNFFLYCLTGHKFRHEVVNVFRRKTSGPPTLNQNNGRTGVTCCETDKVPLRNATVKQPGELTNNHRLTTSHISSHRGSHISSHRGSHCLGTELKNSLIGSPNGVQL